MPLKKLEDLALMIEYYEITTLDTSKSSVGWHIDHCLKVINNICRALKKSDPADYTWKFNFLRMLVFIRGDFPRGRAKAPKSSVAQGEITLNDLQRQLEKARLALSEAPSLPEKSNFQHPYFGLLHRDQSIRFMAIHTHHHLKIIRDIIKNG